jgi:anti-anti-sigma factor
VDFAVASFEPSEADHAVVEVTGEVDQRSRVQLVKALDRVVRSEAKALVVDLTGVTFFSAAGVHCIEDTAEAMAARGGGFHLVCPEGKAAWVVLNVLALLPCWPVHATMADAVDVLTAPTA